MVYIAENWAWFTPSNPQPSNLSDTEIDLRISVDENKFKQL